MGAAPTGNRTIPAAELRAGDLLRCGTSTNYVLLCEVTLEDDTVRAMVHGVRGQCHPDTIGAPDRVVYVGRRGFPLPGHPADGKDNQ